MDSHYLYLTLDLCSIAIPLAFSFYPKAPFYKKWKYLVPAIIIPAIMFLVWDEIFTRVGVWGFNKKYLTGLYVGNLPIEEILFFICIPYACVFTYDALNYLVEKDHLKNVRTPLTVFLIVSLSVIAALNYNKLYTSITFTSLSVWLIILAIIKATFLSRFYLAYAVILIPFFIINGILTGSGLQEPVVWYNDTENMAIRMITIPVEDTFYGMLLILMNVSLFEYFQQRKDHIKLR